MKHKQDYAAIKGVNYGIRPADIAKRDLGYAKRIGINSVRAFLSYDSYVRERNQTMQSLRDFFRVCAEENISIVLVLFSGNRIDPSWWENDFFPKGEEYIKDVVNAVMNEQALLMYDVVNEPTGNDLCMNDPDESKRKEACKKAWAFARHCCEYVRMLDPNTPITIGCEGYELDDIGEIVDVLSYHDYSGTEREIREKAEKALAVSRKYGKLLINNETGCVGRSNPYDLTIRIMNEYGIPWYIFCLMIDGYWSDIHGIFYPDGTVRDPAIAAAVTGCFRNRDLLTMIPEKPNREQRGEWALNEARQLLSDSQWNAFLYQTTDTEKLLEVCEKMANVLEAGQMVPMRIPPTAQIAFWRKQENPNQREIREFAYHLAVLLKDNCHIL